MVEHPLHVRVLGRLVLTRGAMSDNEGSNGHATENGVEMYLHLTFDPLTFRLDVKGSVANLEAARSILQQADRHFEKMQRAAAALELRDTVRQSEQEAHLRALLRGARG